MMADHAMMAKERITLNVGGKVFCTSKATLLPGRRPPRHLARVVGGDRLYCMGHVPSAYRMANGMHCCATLTLCGCSRASISMKQNVM
jgi:hypothetical protein